MRLWPRHWPDLQSSDGVPGAEVICFQQGRGSPTWLLADVSVPFQKAA